LKFNFQKKVFKDWSLIYFCGLNDFCPIIMPEAKPVFVDNIVIKGARVHNLKNISLEIPRDKFIVITGLSGSGKSSLAFDTLYAEGQRRYVESLSAYARQFLGRIDKPDVDFIKGIPPAIAIEQKVNTRNPRSTVGTSTEVYDYLKLLFARLGKTYSPKSGKVVKRHTTTDVIDFILGFPVGSRVNILSELVFSPDRTPVKHLEIFGQQGFSRVEVDGEIVKIAEIVKSGSLNYSKSVYLLIDRISVASDEDTMARLADSIETAFYEGNGFCVIQMIIDEKVVTETFSHKFEEDGIIFDEPSVDMFSFNNPVGACPVCEGFGKILGIDEDLVIPNKNLSIYEDAVACWKGEVMRRWKEDLIFCAEKFKFPIHKPYCELTDKQKEILWEGNSHFQGINSFFKMLEAENYKVQNRVMMARYRGKTTCPSCRGTRLKKEASWVKVNDRSIHDLVLMQINELLPFFKGLKLSDYELKVSKRILIEIVSRLQFLLDVGLGYLTLNRLSSSLSGGESQRINLATSLGSSLVGSLYILDEPSIGLHSKDTELLIKVLKQLKQIGNSVIVVEHDEEIILAADQIIDIGPLAGINGGHVIFQGSQQELLNDQNSMTAKYINGAEKIEIPAKRKKWQYFLQVDNARENNLKGFSVKIPLKVFTCVTGVSGSGKSTLIRNIVYNSLNKSFNGVGEMVGKHDTISGDISLLSGIEFVDQNPIGKSSRSNPVTYIKAYDEIRKLFSDQQLSVQNDFKPAHFSFNVEGGRCEECQGEGFIKVEMQFMADVTLVCESCKGRRFKDEVLEVKFQGKNIHDILDLSVDEAIDFFSTYKGNSERKIVEKLQPLQDVGLGYVKLGQSSSTLSGGESQRVKLAAFLSKENDEKQKLFIFDEPTTGLHFHDIRKLLEAFNALINKGNTILIIEHNLDVIKSADWVIDLGPDGGDKGGEIVAEGTPEDVAKNPRSYTGKYLKEKLKR
jgi:excinuclease ABC subunit A